MSKVFITGVAGLLGSHLAEHFLKQGWEVVACDNMLGGYYDNIPKKVKFLKKVKNTFDLKALFYINLRTHFWCLNFNISLTRRRKIPNIIDIYFL
jgi:UDP-glucose 4-epimerase